MAMFTTLAGKLCSYFTFGHLTKIWIITAVFIVVHRASLLDLLRISL